MSKLSPTKSITRRMIASASSELAHIACAEVPRTLSSRAMIPSKPQLYTPSP